MWLRRYSYRLGSLGFKHQWGADFATSIHTSPKVSESPVQWELGLFHGGKADGPQC
jgi:hypothetical protein